MLEGFLVGSQIKKLSYKVIHLIEVHRSLIISVRNYNATYTVN